MIRGERVSLRPFRQEDLPSLRRWFDDGEVMRYWGNSSPLVSEHAFEADLAPDGRFTKFEENGYFCICDESGRPIGRVEYEGLSSEDRSAELGILIGEKDAWNKGYGPEAIVLLLDWLFNQRGAHRVWLTVQARNARAQRAYEKVGFAREGTWREHYFYDGAFHDEYLYGILAEEFRERHGRVVEWSSSQVASGDEPSAVSRQPSGDSPHPSPLPRLGGGTVLSLSLREGEGRGEGGPPGHQPLDARGEVSSGHGGG